MISNTKVQALLLTCDVVLLLCLTSRLSARNALHLQHLLAADLLLAHHTMPGHLYLLADVCWIGWSGRVAVPASDR